MKICEFVKECIEKRIPESEIDIVNFSDDVNFDEFKRIIFVVPEWNGSIPWTLKKMIDDSGWPSKLKNKKVSIIGTSGSFSGNQNGVNHLFQILSFIGCKIKTPFVYIPNCELGDLHKKLINIQVNAFAPKIKKINIKK